MTAPDLVLLDIGLPDVDGLEVLDRVLREEPAISVIILADDEDVALARAGLQIGAADCLFKPAGLYRLGNAVALSVARMETSGVVASLPRPLDGPASSRSLEQLEPVRGVVRIRERRSPRQTLDLTPSVPVSRVACAAHPLGGGPKVIT